MSQDRLISSQIIEGTFDSTLFENFIYQTLRHVRTDPELRQRRVVLLMDNAVIHKYSDVLETIRKFKVTLLFNAEYSPWLNPVEHLFQALKQQLKMTLIENK